MFFSLQILYGHCPANFISLLGKRKVVHFHFILFFFLLIMMGWQSPSCLNVKAESRTLILPSFQYHFWLTPFLHVSRVSEQLSWVSSHVCVRTHLQTERTSGKIYKLWKIVWGWHWVKRSHRVQVYIFMIRDLDIALPSHHPVIFCHHIFGPFTRHYSQAPSLW